MIWRRVAALAVTALVVFEIDRFEPPMAVLIAPDGRTLDVPLASLPPHARPGDRLAGPSGPVIGNRAARKDATRAVLERLAELPSPRDGRVTPASAVDMETPPPPDER